MKGRLLFFFSSTLGEKRSSTCKVARVGGGGGGRRRGDAERGRAVDRGVSRPEFQRVTLGTMTSWTDFPRPPCPCPEVFRAAKECSKRSRGNPKKEKITG